MLQILSDPRPKRLKKLTILKKKKKKYFGLPISLVSANISLENSLGYLFLFVNRSRDFQVYGTFYDIVSTKY